MNQQQLPPEAATREERKPPNTLGFIGLAVSLVGLVLGFCIPPATLLCLAGIVISGIAMSRPPRGVPVAGLAVGVAGVIYGAIFLFFVSVPPEPAPGVPDQQVEPPEPRE